MDFTLILVVIVLVSGLIYGLDILYFKNRRGGSEPGIIIDYSRSFFPVLFLVLLLRSFLFEPFQIPSGSMLPTLKIGDFILVNKFDYGLRLPVLGKTIYEVGQPSRGDVMVFKYPEDPNINFIKRVVGIPGDTVEYRNKVVYVNVSCHCDLNLLSRSRPFVGLRKRRDRVSSTHIKFRLLIYYTPTPVHISVCAKQMHHDDRHHVKHVHVHDDISVFSI